MQLLHLQPRATGTAHLVKLFELIPFVTTKTWCYENALSLDLIKAETSALFFHMTRSNQSEILIPALSKFTLKVCLEDFIKLFVLSLYLLLHLALTHPLPTDAEDRILFAFST